MATVNKDFKVKNGLIVEGTTAKVNNYDILTKKPDDQTYIIGLIGGAATSDNTADTVVLRDEFGNFAAGEITADLQGNVTGNVTGTVSDISNHNTDGLAEGATNKYFTDARALTATASAYDPAGSAATAQAAAEAFATSEADAAEAAAIAAAALDATSKANTAEANAIAYADALTTDDIAEGSAQYFTDARARDAVSAGSGLDYNSITGEFSADLGFGLQFDVNGQIEIDGAVVATDQNVSDAITAHDVASGVHGITGSVVGTTDAQTVSNKTLGSNLDAGTYTVTNLGTPVNSTDAATKGYVDSVAEGLHVHASVAVATTGNIVLAPAPATIDTVTLTSGMRVLVKDQTSAAENGIYEFDGTDLVRAEDYDTLGEIQAGDFVFVSGGATYTATGWVQESTVSILGTDAIVWSQFSGAGEYTAGTGITLTGTEFSADTTYLATKDYVDGEVDSHTALTTGVHGITGDVVGTTDTQTITNKTLGANTVLGANLDAVNTYKVTNLVDPTSNQDAATKAYVDAAEADAVSTANSYTDGEITDALVTAQGYADAAELAAIAHADALTTTDIEEGTNLYFTNQRAIDAVGGTIGDAIDLLDTDDIEEGTTNLYFTSSRAKSSAAELLTGATLTNITITGDGSGLIITAENGVADSTTSDLIEGSNLYFTDARAVDALEAVVPNFTEVDINSLATQVASTTSVTTASQASVYSFAKADYRSAEFLVKTAYGNHTEISKVLLTLDTSDNIAITEYGTIGTNGSSMSISADIDGSNVRLLVTTTNNNSTVNVVGTLLA